MKRKLFFLLCALLTSVGMWGQEWTDVTSTYITNADLKSISATASEDAAYWPVYTTGRTADKQKHPKNWYLHTNGTKDHNGGGDFYECWAADQGVKRWTLFQDIAALPAGTYRLTGQYSTNESRGIIKTVVITPHHTYFSPGITTSNWGVWGSETAEFTIYETTKVRVGMISNNFAQNHGFTLTTTGAKQLLADEIAAAPAGVSTTAAQAVYDDGGSDDAAYRSAAKTLHDAIVAYNIENASAGSPVDMTDYITDPSFEGIANATAYTGESHDLMSAWSAPTVSDGGARSLTGNSYLVTDNSEDGFYAVNLWNGSAITYYVQQTISGLPVGLYKLTATYASDNSNTATLSMGTAESTITATDKGHFVEGTVTYNHASSGDVIIKLSSSNWYKADNFKLSYLGDPVKALKQELLALQASIDDDYLDNPTYSNVTGDERTDLVAAKSITAASETVEAYETAISSVESAIANFTGAKSNYDAYVAAKAVVYPTLAYASTAKRTALDNAQSAADATSASDADAKKAAILTAARQFYESHALAEGVDGAENKTSLITDPNLDTTIEGMTAGAWTFTQGGGNAQILSSESFTDGDGNHNYKYFDYYNGDNNGQHLYQTISNLPAGNYLLTVTARADSKFNGYFYLTLNDGGNISSENIPAIGNSGGIFDRGWNDVNLQFVHTADGNVTIEVYSDGGSGSGKRAGWWGATRFRLVRLSDATVSKTITSAKWATYCSPFALDFSSDIANLTKAYIVTGVADSKLTLVEVEGTVPANTGLLLKGEGACAIPVAVSSPTDVSSNKLVGVTSSTPLAVEAGYVLMGSPTVGFYKNSKAFTLGANTAYLPAGFDAGARTVLYLDEDDAPTAINAIEAAETEGLKDGKYFIGNKIILVKNGVKYGANGQILK